MRKAVIVSVVPVVLILCAVVQAWTPPAPVESGVNTSIHEFLPFLSFDSSTLYFSRNDGSYTNIYQATRQGTSGPFTSVTKALDRGSASHVMGAWVSQDNLRMYYHEEAGSWSMKMSTRASVSNPWTGGTVIPGLSSVSAPIAPKLTQDELTIVFGGTGGMGSYDIGIATRPNTSSPFGNITNLSALNSSSLDANPYITPNGLALYFESNRNGSYQLFKATRDSLGDPFANLEHLSFFDSPYNPRYPALSVDGITLFFSQGTQSNGVDIYFSEIPEPASAFLMIIGAAMLRKKS